MHYSLLKAAEEYHLPKEVKSACGGGLKEFSLHDYHIYDGIEDEEHFFTTNERQWLILRLLEGIRAMPSDLDAVQGINLVEGQPIGLL